MPWAPARACREPGCPGLVTEAGAARCPEHQQAYRQALDAGRPSARRRGYDKAWERVRSAFLAAHPRCTFCGAAATDVDHIKAKRAGGSDDWSNLRSLCHGCHSSRTAQDQGGFGRR